jgi:hypothetical protein
MQEQLLLVLILIFCFVFRAYPRVKQKYAIAGDTFFHLKHGEEIRKNGFGIFYELRNSVIKIVYSYPYLYHWFLALFSTKARLWAERFTGAFFDTLNVLIIYIFTNWYLDFHQLDYPNLTLLTCFLYSISPALLRFNGGPRSFNGSPRIMAQTLYLVHLFSFYYYYETGNYGLLFVSIFFGGLLLIGSTFGTQVLLFFAVVMSVLFSPYYFLVLLASLLLIFISSRGKVLRVLRGHFGHSRFLAERISQQSPWQNKFPGYIANIKAFFECIFKPQFKRAVPYLHDENYPIHNFIFYYPSFFILLKFDYYSEHKFLYSSILAAIVLYIFTSFKRFKFLGEPVRYLDYVLVPSYILTYIFLKDAGLLWINIGFLVYALISAVYFMQQFFKLFPYINADYHNLKEKFEEIDKMEHGNLFAFNSVGHMSYYFTKQPIVNALIGNLDVNLFSKEDSDLVIGNYPLPGKDFEKIISRFDIKYIVMNRNDLNQYTTKILDSPDIFHSRVKQLFETKTALFFKVI